MVGFKAHCLWRF